LRCDHLDVLHPSAVAHDPKPRRVDDDIGRRALHATECEGDAVIGIGRGNIRVPEKAEPSLHAAVTVATTLPSGVVSGIDGISGLKVSSAVGLGLRPFMIDLNVRV
jgi:hypothetical protein